MSEDKKNEELTPDWVANGNKIRSGGRIAHFMVAISYQKGAIMCEENEKNKRSIFFRFVRLNSRQIVHECINPNSGLFLKDGALSQYSKAITEIERLVGNRSA